MIRSSNRGYQWIWQTLQANQWSSHGISIAPRALTNYCSLLTQQLPLLLFCIPGSGLWFPWKQHLEAAWSIGGSETDDVPTAGFGGWGSATAAVICSSNSHWKVAHRGNFSGSGLNRAKLILYGKKVFFLTNYVNNLLWGANLGISLLERQVWFVWCVCVAEASKWSKAGEFSRTTITTEVTSSNTSSLSYQV